MSGGDSSGELERQLNSVFDDIIAARRNLITDYETVIRERWMKCISGKEIATYGTANGAIGGSLGGGFALFCGASGVLAVVAAGGLAGLCAYDWFCVNGVDRDPKKLDSWHTSRLASAAQCEAKAFSKLEQLLPVIGQKHLSRAARAKLQILKPVLGLGEPIADASYDEAVTRFGGPVLSSDMAAFSLHEFVSKGFAESTNVPTAKLDQVLAAVKQSLQDQLNTWLSAA